jgi:hypothetical protein
MKIVLLVFRLFSTSAKGQFEEGDVEPSVVSGGIVECALAYQPGDSGFNSHFSREFSGGAWITLHTEAANQE